MGGATKVLILSDDARVREPAIEVLLRSGHVVDEAADAEAALRVAGSRRPPDVVLIDTLTVGAAATDLLGELQAAHGGRPVQTVLLARDGASERLRRHPSVDHVIDSPSAMGALMALADWLERRVAGRPRTPAKAGDPSGGRRRVG